MNKKRILIISLTYFPFVGGAEMAIKEITDRLSEFDFEMLTVNLDGQQKIEEKIGNVLVRRIGKGKISKYLFPFTAYRFARTLQQKNNYQIIWSMMANQAGLAALFFKLKFPQIKYLLTLQEGDSELDIWLRTWFMRPLYKMIYRRADLIQAISSYLAKRAVKLDFKGRIEVVPNAAGFEKGAFRIEEEYPKHPKLDFLKNSKLVITTSRLVKKNGIKYLIRAIKNIEAKLLILGDGPLRNDLEELAISLGLKQEKEKLTENDKVYFLGHQNSYLVGYYLSKADIFVRPSVSEGLGSSFLEAMAVGIPIVGTPVGGIPDFLKNGETGWFCKVRDSKSIAEKINYILNPQNKIEVNRVVSNAKNLIEKKYNWQNVAQKMKGIFESLCPVVVPHLREDYYRE